MSNIDSQANISAVSTAKAPLLLKSNESDAKILEKVKTLLEGHRHIYESGEAAFKQLQTISEIEGMSLPILVAGHGNVSTLEAMPDWATGRVGVSLLGVKKEKTSGARAIVIMPVPTVEDYDADSAGHDWLDKIVVKETSHVAFRALRNVPDTSESIAELEQAAQRMPVTVTDYAEQHRATAAISLEAFNTVWPALRQMLLKEWPALKTALPAKSEIINAIRSKSYATREYADLESQNLFPFIGDAVVKMCGDLKDEKTGQPAPVDASEVEDWLESREALNIAPKERQALTTTLDLAQFKF
jgi:hypothetical protein